MLKLTNIASRAFKGSYAKIPVSSKKVALSALHGEMPRGRLDKERLPEESLFHSLSKNIIDVRQDDDCTSLDQRFSDRVEDPTMLYTTHGVCYSCGNSRSSIPGAMLSPEWLLVSWSMLVELESDSLLPASNVSCITVGVVRIGSLDAPSEGGGGRFSDALMTACALETQR